MIIKRFAENVEMITNETEKELVTKTGGKFDRIITDDEQNVPRPGDNSTRRKTSSKSPHSPTHRHMTNPTEMNGDERVSESKAGVTNDADKEHARCYEWNMLDDTNLRK